jgi:tetrahydromethanopterin S-methyltransferase subunit B
MDNLDNYIDNLFNQAFPTTTVASGSGFPLPPATVNPPSVISPVPDTNQVQLGANLTSWILKYAVYGALIIIMYIGLLALIMPDEKTTEGIAALALL